MYVYMYYGVYTALYFNINSKLEAKIPVNFKLNRAFTLHIVKKKMKNYELSIMRANQQ